MKIDKRAVAVVALFALSFMTIGWVAPAMYAAYAPSDQYIKSHAFEANNTTVGTEHVSCFDRTVYRESAGLVFTELYLVNGDDERIKVLSVHDEQLFTEGRTLVRIKTSIPDGLEPGVYRYERAYRMSLANGRVERTFSFSSEPFHVMVNGTAGEPVC